MALLRTLGRPYDTVPDVRGETVVDVTVEGGPGVTRTLLVPSTTGWTGFVVGEDTRGPGTRRTRGLDGPCPPPPRTRGTPRLRDGCSGRTIRHEEVQTVVKPTPTGVDGTGLLARREGPRTCSEPIPGVE